MPYARTAEHLESLRAKGILPPQRYPSGKRKILPDSRSDRQAHIAARDDETESQRMATALAQPHRRAASDPRDPRAGYALGRAFLRGDLDTDQLAAARRYTELALRHMQHVTGRMPRFPCQAIEDGAKGESCGAEMSDDDVMKLRQAWEDAQTILADTWDWSACVKALYNVGLMDREPSSALELQALRLGTTALHRAWS